MTSYKSSRIILDRTALVNNFRRLKQEVGKLCEVAGVVKANAYGLGTEIAVPALVEAGCKFFYVAHLEEAFEVRKLTSSPIAVLSGVPSGGENDFVAKKFIPVLNSPDDVRTWVHGPSIWHVDTGMNRLGLGVNEFSSALSSTSHRPYILMTHFVASDEIDNPLSAEQVRRFDDVAKSLPNTTQSICNSSGIFRHSTWHRQQVRSGMALYGLNPTPETDNPMQPVVRVETKILQTRHAKAEETVGYNATRSLNRDSILATVGLGYADGFLRSGSNCASLYWQGHSCPILGRVSMDLIVVDLTDCLSPLPHAGDWLEVIGPRQSADALATSLGTIGYEVFTSLSLRAERVTL